MCFTARARLGIATVLSLFLVVMQVATPVALANDDSATDVAGIDVDATTIPEFQALMNEGKLTSEQLTEFYLDRIDALDRSGAAPGELLTELRGLLREAESQARAEKTAAPAGDCDGEEVVARLRQALARDIIGL